MGKRSKRVEELLADANEKAKEVLAEDARVRSQVVYIRDHLRTASVATLNARSYLLGERMGDESEELQEICLKLSYALDYLNEARELFDQFIKSGGEAA